MAAPEPASHCLASVPLFAGLPETVLTHLAGTSRVRQFPRGQILVSEGDPGDHLIVLEAGQLRVSRYSPAGVEVVLAVVDAPAALGELALLDGQPRDATITAQQAVTVRLVPRQAFRQVLHSEPALIDGLLATLADMVRAANARHADLIGLDLPGRLARWMLRRAGETPIEGQPITVTQSQAELAAELGATRSTLNRALHDFADQGIIDLNGTQITLRKVDRLRDLLT
jgi:CRP/FNR family transcriptional regulator, cyclic AMP receptor protein